MRDGNRPIAVEGAEQPRARSTDGSSSKADKRSERAHWREERSTPMEQEEQETREREREKSRLRGSWLVAKRVA